MKKADKTSYLNDSLKNEEDALNLNMNPVNILIVDDLPEKLMIYQSILEDLGQTLVTASSGEEALKLVLKQEFAVILLDVNMPGLDGFETAALIRNRKKSSHVPIIFLTAFTDELLIAQGYASGAVDYLPMPIMPEVLRAKVRVFIELFQMRRQAALQAEERAGRKAAEETAQRSAFLAKFSEVVARSQSQADILRALVQMPIPSLANMCMTSFADEAGIHQVEWASSDMEGSDLSATALPTLPWLDQAISQVLKSGQFQILTELPFSPALPDIDYAIVLPIMVRSQIRGVFVLARAYSQSLSQLGDVSLASDLAGRAGVALENVLLIERIREADRRKDEFLGMLAHELRNPLGLIRNAVQLLQMSDQKEPYLDQLRSIVDRQVTHMARLIDDLLDATRLARGQILLRKESCDLTKIVRQTTEDYRNIFENSGLKLEITAPTDPLWIKGDPTRLVQAIDNLLNNAQKFTDRGGVITINLDYDKKAEIATITIRDTGIGIEPSVIPYVFDVFRQADQGLDRNRGGLGLGLALVKGLVELHNGEVSVVSDGLGMGTTFTITLQIESVPMATAPFSAETESREGIKCRILVIEDNHDAAETAKLLLSREGYEVQIAHSGANGLKIADTFLPQVILCDIGLPGMDGYQVVRTIRQNPVLSSVYAIALTGYGREEDQLHAHQAGFDLHLTKPIDYNILHHALTHLQACT